ncbi:phosphatidylserine decarboxylase [Nitrosospira lacus]|uniref:Phosphatidylserine decarboxylase proenzyme n=1 Tax=Nitrosospira lacus TaxID=1288494 RepID=A0A1W6SND2_9PROT|nr:archaetidylserine decarboxylase [Nitrosospira lacus]ARO87272.1 phosphatidylserine decarboxylase [Nitrosospira lacus]
MLTAFSVFPQYLLPKQALTELAGKFAKANAGALTTFAIRRFIQHYDVDMSEAVNSDIHSYLTFNDFFTRALLPEKRPIAEASYICPVDGAISQLGVIRSNQIIQAKGRNYSATALMGGDSALAEKFYDGNFATLYLSPKDYHRVHMPCSGRLTRMIYIPGTLFSVNPGTVRGIPGLFARNERVVCVFESERGPFVVVLVGATIVGSISTVWHGIVNSRRAGQVRDWRYDSQALVFEKGREMGRFLLGSTVVMLFPRNRIVFNPLWTPGRTIRFGEMMGTKADELR